MPVAHVRENLSLSLSPSLPRILWQNDRILIKKFHFYLFARPRYKIEGKNNIFFFIKPLQRNV